MACSCPRSGQRSNTAYEVLYIVDRSLVSSWFDRLPFLAVNFPSDTRRVYLKMNALVLGALAIAGVAAQADIYTATQSDSVAAARATAKTSQPTSNVKGKVRSTESDRDLTTPLTAHNRSSIAMCQYGLRTPTTPMLSEIPTCNGLLPRVSAYLTCSA